VSDELEVLAGFTSGWQPLDRSTLKKDDDAGRAILETATSALREELGHIVNAENLIVLAGLGTSLGVENPVSKKSAPKMADLWALIAALPSFSAVQGSLDADLIKSKNLEHVLSDAQTRLAVDKSRTDISAFIEESEAVIWESCSFVDDDSLVDSHELFLRKVGRRSTRLQRTQVFTTNYDLVFETAATRSRFNIIDGFGYGGQTFDGASFDLDYVRRRPNEPLALEPSVLHLLKLHGSVDWDSSSGGVRKVIATTKPAKPVLIYPSSAKYQQSFQQPYLEFMSRFQIALRQPDVGLIIVGFGLNDEHLVAPIEAALRSNIGLRVILVTPGAKARQSPSIAWMEALIKKGDRRITLLAGTFDDLVKLLPDVPSREERDAHADRIASAGGKSR
jgi:SIR2-like domain